VTTDGLVRAAGRIEPKHQVAFVHRRMPSHKNLGDHASVGCWTFFTLDSTTSVPGTTTALDIGTRTLQPPGHDEAEDQHPEPHPELIVEGAPEALRQCWRPARRSARRD